MSIPVELSRNGLEVAIIGMAGRFPDAKNIEEFWHNLQHGVESITSFTDEELIFSGIDPAMLNDPQYVKSRATLEDVELFDASFFGFNPREAEIIDPQQRLFLECAWQALENAGYDSKKYKGLVGVYAGAAVNSYVFNLYSNLNIRNSVDDFQLLLANDKDFLTTRVSYKLDLEGPSIDIQTACSTSLVAIHLACRSLLSGESDIALAGGVTISSLRKTGYLYKEGGIASPDGHCRAFDANAQGTVSGEGVGIVVLKRLEDALADGDRIHAVIKGSAINNDGALKVSYTAPRIDTQAKVIKAAQTIAEVDPDTITYIEAHGTGTSLGDPIEIAALTQAFQTSTQEKSFCAIGSLKTNIGHLDAAAGVAGLIKTVLALKHKKIPPSLHFKQANPQIDFDNSPFYVNATLSEWQANGTPRRAGVSSFGIGGTNAHVILEEAPVVEPSGPSRPIQLLLLSAKTDSALETATANLVTHLKQHTSLNLADVAYTLQVGRREFDHRRIVVCQNLEDASQVLSSQDPQRIFTHYQEPCNRSMVFMFSGQGAQYVNMGKELYQSEPIFREQVDECCELLKPDIGLDLRTVLYPGEQQAQQATQQLLQTAITQPALFVIEYALAQLWMAWGVQPEAMIGHSIGEYVAATLGGVFSLKDALALVAKRGKLMQQLPTGAMLSVQLPEHEVRPLLEPELSLAASNSPSYCVVSGSTEAVEKLQQQLQEKGAGCRRLHTNHAFHSVMMEPIIDLYRHILQKVKLNSPEIPFVSNVSGTWITQAEATDPNYWAKHLRQPVRFSEGVTELLKQPKRIFLEVGPGRTLSTFTLQHQKEGLVALTSLRHPQEQHSDVAFLLNTLGRLWLFGVQIDWSSLYTDERRHRIPLPTYPFERQRYWIEANPKAALATVSHEPLHKKPNITDWFYVPVWKQSMPLELLQQEELAQQKLCWLVFVDAYGVGAEIAKRLEQQSQDVIIVRVAEQFTKLDERTYTIDPQQRDDYDALLKALQQQDLAPQAIAHFWSVTPNETLLSNTIGKQTQSPHQFFEDCQHLGFWSLLFLAQALGKQDITNSLKLMVVTSNVHDVTGDENLCPEKATVLGPCKVIPKEYPNISCCSIDVVIPSSETSSIQPLIDYLVTEFIAQQTEEIVAYRGHHRWVQTYEAVRLDEHIAGKTKLREGGVYLITGGLGGIGLVLAEYLAKTLQAKLILIGRTGLPDRLQWEQWLATHDSQDAVSRKIQKVLALEKLGAQVQVNSADVADPEQMQVVIAQALKQFGQINGVIHAAGNAGGGVVQLKTPEIAANVLAPKVKGTLVLEEVLKNINLDFFVLCSSLDSILGGFGQVDYCAANAFLDAYARRHATKSGQLTVSINWDAWQEVGMAVETTVPDEIKKGRQESLEKGIVPQEGTDAFNRILHSRLPHVVVSTQDFQTVIEQNHSFQSLEEGLAFLEEKLASANISKSAHPRPNLANDYIAPRNEVEQAVAEIWQQLLGIEQIGIYDNFFELGGHSLLATQVISRLRKEFKVNLGLHSFFEKPTVTELATEIEKTSKTDSGLEPITIERISRSHELPLSFAQQRLWFLTQLDPESPYNVFAAVRLEGQLNLTALQQSFNEILCRHEALRTNFKTVEGRAIAVISSMTPLLLPILDLSKLPFEQQDSTVRQLALVEGQQPFDLKSELLLRVRLLRLSEQEHIVLLTMHHIVSDGWSMGVFVQELAALYEAFCAEKPSPLPELPIQYADFAVWQRQRLQGKRLEAQLVYWKKQLGNNLPVMQLPTTRPRTEVKTNKGATQSFLIPSNVSQGLEALSRQQGVTLFMSLLAGFQIFLQRYTNQDDIVVGTDVANRNQAEIESLIGFFVNLLVLRTHLGGNPTFGELLKRVRSVTLGAYAHQDLPFEQLVKALQPERNLSNTPPLFQVLFVLQNAPMPLLELPNLTLSMLEVENKIARFDIALFLTETEQGLLGKWQYNSDLFDATTITSMTDNFQTLLNSIVSQPDARISNLEMLTDAEREQQALQKRERKAFKREKFISVAPKAVSQSQQSLIKIDYLQPGQTFPLVIQPNTDEIDFIAWAKNNRGFIETELLKHGAILFRGFHVDSVSEFESVAQAVCPDLFGEYGDLPRAGESAKVYGSTPYPPDKAILLHNESSHLHQFPLKIWFFCVQSAEQGGETPIVDCRKAYQLLNPKLRELLTKKQLMYTRHYTDSLDVSWQDFFRTNDKYEVENYCRHSGIHFEWYDNNSLVTRQVRPAVAVHPKSSERVFFNQIQLHHIAYLDGEVRESLLSLFGEKKLPRNVYYGDGTPIEDEVITEINEVYQQSKTSFPWQKGDILMLDNMLAAHGRYPYEGQRKIVVAMGEMIQNQDITLHDMQGGGK